MPRPTKGKRQGGFGGSHGPPRKKRRFDGGKKKKRAPLSPEEKKIRCIAIIKTFQEALEKKSMNLVTLPEIDDSKVGIKVFANNTGKTMKPIIGNVKNKLEDFFVSEIDESGKVAKITNDDDIEDPKAAIQKGASFQNAKTIVSECFLLQCPNRGQNHGQNI